MLSPELLSLFSTFSLESFDSNTNGIYKNIYANEMKCYKNEKCAMLKSTNIYKRNLYAKMYTRSVQDAKQMILCNIK